jgi:hypothetical protein
MSNNNTHNREATIGRVPAYTANINNDTSRSNIGGLIVEVEPGIPGETERPLYYLGTEDEITPKAIASAILGLWLDATGIYLFKSPNGPGYVTEDQLRELIQAIEAECLPADPTPLTEEDDPGSAPLTAPEQEPSGGDGGIVVPPVEVAQAPAPAPVPEDEAVVMLAYPVGVEAPYFRASDRSPFDLKSSPASYIYGLGSDNYAVVLRNVFGRRRTPYKVRPPLASNEAALARKLHGKSSEELKARVRGTATRTGPATPVAAWAEMLSALTLFPEFLDELNLSEEQINGITKILHNANFMKSQKADHHGCYFQIPDATPEVEIRGVGQLPWVFVGPREPDELMRLALLVKLLNYKATRRSRNSGAPSAVNPPGNPA